ncbi:hypothetical protein V8F06_010071 [Rhypophila decipiens]
MDKQDIIRANYYLAEAVRFIQAADKSSTRGVMTALPRLRELAALHRPRRGEGSDVIFEWLSKSVHLFAAEAGLVNFLLLDDMEVRWSVVEASEMLYYALKKPVLQAINRPTLKSPVTDGPLSLRLKDMVCCLLSGDYTPVPSAQYISEAWRIWFAKVLARSENDPNLDSAEIEVLGQIAESFIKHDADLDLLDEYRDNAVEHVLFTKCLSPQNHKGNQSLEQKHLRRIWARRLRDLIARNKRPDLGKTRWVNREDLWNQGGRVTSVCGSEGDDDNESILDYYYDSADSDETIRL